MVKTSLGFVQSHGSESSAERVATRGGWGSRVGIMAAGVFRCDNVMLISSLGHKMTIALFSIVVPKPLMKNVIPF